VNGRQSAIAETVAMMNKMKLEQQVRQLRPGFQHEFAPRVNFGPAFSPMGLKLLLLSLSS
jgi:hypothetical protein